MGAKRREGFKILKDRISEMPDEILSFTLSLMPMREAARTSILSRRWRYLWKTSVVFSSSLNLDVLAMRGSEYSDDMFRVHVCGSGYSDDSRLLLIERTKFVEWVDLILQLDYSPVIDSYRLRYYFKNDFAHLIDQWINVAVTKRVQNIDIDLSHFHSYGNRFPSEELYVFPSKLFTQETGSIVKRLSLNSCILGPLDFNCFRSIVDLQLEHVVINQDNFVSFLSNCPNLERLSFIKCWRLLRLEISGPFLKLKYLTIVSCHSLRDIEIDAKNLTGLEYWGGRVNFSFLNVPKLSNVIVDIACGRHSSVALTNVLQKFSIHLPKLESLIVQFQPCKENIIPSQFANLRKLLLMLTVFEETLWGCIPLLHASPCLHRLELHWWPSSNLKKFEAGLTPSSDSPHLHLKKIMLGGYTGSTHEIAFTRYLLNNAPTLEKMTIMGYKAKWYRPNEDFHIFEDNGLSNDPEAACKRKKMEEKASEQLIDVLRPGVQLKFL